MKAKIQIDYQTPEQNNATVVNKGKGYNTILAGEDIDPKLINGVTGRPLVQDILDNNPHWLEVDTTNEKKAVEDKKDLGVAEKRKARKDALYKLNKTEQVEVLSNLGLDAKQVTALKLEKERVNKILAIEFK